VTHDQAEALSMGREVGVLRAGRLVQTAAPAALYRAPADLDVARFVGEAVVVPGQAQSGQVVCSFGTLPVRGSTLEGAVDVMIRPEQIRLERGAAPQPNGRGVAARVLGGSYYGPDTVLRLELADGSGTLVTARTYDEVVDAPGDEVTLMVAGAVAVYTPERAAAP